MTTTAQLDRLLRARSVAIVGASEKPGALGNAVLRNLERHGFDGTIHLINPKRPVIEGRQALGGVDELPAGVDAAVLAIPGPGVVATLRQLAERGVGAAIVFSAGFAEGGEDGVAAQAEITRIASDSGMVVLGPNCLGATSHLTGLPLTFVEVAANQGSLPGVGIVSQSGAMAVVLGTVLQAKDMAVSVSVSTGNEAASGVEEFVEYLVDEPNTKAIGMVVEHFRAPARFLAAARRAHAAGKAIVLLHPGTSSAARESAATHTGALAGDWAVMSTLVRRAGVLLVDSLEELADTLDLAVRCPGIPRGGIAVLTESGAFKALTLDLAERLALDLPTLSPSTQQAMRAALPDFIPVSNPMDLTAQSLVDPDLYRKMLAPLVADERIGTIVLAIIQTDERTSTLKLGPIVTALRELQPAKPIVFAGLDEGATVPAQYIRDLRSLGVPYFPTPDRAFRALGRLGQLQATQDAEAIPHAVTLSPGEGTLPEYLSKRLLAEVGIPFPDGSFVTKVDKAVAVAQRIGYPVVLKAQATALSHKSDAGGVLLGITDDDALRTAWHTLESNISRNAPGVTLDGVLVERMVGRGVELILGARNDPDWGPILLVGFGGVQAEILKDVRLLPADLSAREIAQELRSLKSGALLDGWRGSAKLDVEAVAAIATMLGAVVRGTSAIQEIDLNPVIAYPAGRGAITLDALIIASSSPGQENPA